jgi:hypothetical protein
VPVNASPGREVSSTYTEPEPVLMSHRVSLTGSAEGYSGAGDVLLDADAPEMGVGNSASSIKSGCSSSYTAVSFHGTAMSYMKQERNDSLPGQNPTPSTPCPRTHPGRTDPRSSDPMLSLPWSL